MNKRDRLDPSVLEIVRGCWGAYELGRAGRAATFLGAHPSDRRARAVVRVLGARHLVQAAMTLNADPVGHLVGGTVDLTHSASMVLVASLDRRRRRGAAASAAIALAFGIAELVVAVARSAR